jgi:hypothetical protein
MKKTQAGLELMAVIALFLIFTLGINNIFFKLNVDALLISERETVVSKCLDINTLISKILAEPNLEARIDLGYNVTFNSTARLMTLFLLNDSYTCGLITARIRNSTGSAQFIILPGERTIKNNGQEVVII